MKGEYMHRYILLDLDGTVSDPKVGICTSVQYALKKMGITVEDINELTPFIGPPLRDSFKKYYGIKDEDIEKTIGYYRERFSVIGLFENDLYDGMEAMLRKLKANGKKIAISSSKPRVFVQRILEHFKIDEYFDVVMGSELDGRRESKIDVINETLRLLFDGAPVDKEKVVMVGDRLYDVEGAKLAGVKSVGVSYGYGTREELKNAGADVICDSVYELTEELLNH